MIIDWSIVDASGVVVRTYSGPDKLAYLPDLLPGREVVWVEAPPGCDWWTGTEFAARPAKPTPFHVWQAGAWVDPRTAEEHAEAMAAEVTAKAAQLLDAKARERRWDDLASLRAAIGSPNPQWHLEAQDGLRWHAEVWQQLHAAEDDIRAGRRPMPASADAVLAELPALRWHDEQPQEPS